MFRKAPYDGERDLAPISTGCSQPTILAVHPSMPVKSVKEFIALAKARPGEINYGTGVTITGPLLAVELFKHQAKVNIVRINYRGTGPAALLQGYQLRVTVTVRKRGETQVLVRANAQYMEKAVEEPGPYQQFFTALEKAMFLTAQQVD